MHQKFVQSYSHITILLSSGVRTGNFPCVTFVRLEMFIYTIVEWEMSTYNVNELIRKNVGILDYGFLADVTRDQF